MVRDGKHPRPGSVVLSGGARMAAVSSRGWHRGAFSPELGRPPVVFWAQRRSFSSQKVKRALYFRICPVFVPPLSRTHTHTPSHVVDEEAEEQRQSSE